MKGIRIVRVILIVALAAYLWLFHTANRQQVELPILSNFLPPLPVAYVVAFAIVLGWAVGFVPSRLRVWRRGRELTKLRAKLAEYETAAAPPAPYTAAGPASAHSSYATAEREVPVIPDRGDQYGAELYRTEPPSDDEAG